MSGERGFVSEGRRERARSMSRGRSAVRRRFSLSARQTAARAQALGWTGIAAGAVCALAGGVLGTTVLLWLVGWGEIGYPSLIVGGVSGTVIGGFVGFLASSFLEVALRAWSEALNGSRLSAEEGLSAVGCQLSARAIAHDSTAGRQPIADSR